MAMASGIVLSVFAVFCAIDEKFGVQSELRPSDIPGTVSIAQFHPLRAAIFFAAAGTIIVIAAVALYLLVSHRDRQGESASFAKVLIVQMGLVGALMLPIF